MKEYLEKLKAKPRAVRERIAIGTSLGVSGVIAVAWLMVVMFTPYLSPAPSETDLAKSLSETRSSFGDAVAGVAAADDEDTTAEGVLIVDTTSEKPAEPTPAAISF